MAYVLAILVFNLHDLIFSLHLLLTRKKELIKINQWQLNMDRFGT